MSGRDSNPSLMFVEARGVPVSVAFTIFGVNVSVRVFTCDGREDASNRTEYPGVAPGTSHTYGRRLRVDAH